MSYFSSLYPRINYPIASDTSRGLRRVQLGAIHAIASHFTVYKDAALVVMPTGSGKTAVLNLVPYLLRANRILVISSSVLVRGQIYDEFLTMRTLKASNVFHGEITPPKPKEIKSPIRSLGQWEELRDYDVVIGIPNSINEGINELSSPPEDFFDLILVDEAHHVPAFTWTNIIRHFNKAKHVFFTATPFRRDRKEIEGRLVYNYPLSKAYEDKIFGNIGYYSVVTDSIDSDLAIAQETEKIFLKDKEDGYQHFIMVRTESKDSAEKLDMLYAEKTSLKLKKVDSSVTYRTITKTIEKLKKGELDGIICVDMLGEGFDFPNLKIAAIHSPKKSLANTLQFIGRFARTNAERIGEAKFIAIPNDIEIGKRKLYEEGAIWNEIIHTVSDQKITEEDELKTVIDTFEKDLHSKGRDNISFYNLNPYCHVKVYKADGINLNATISAAGQDIIYHAVSQEYHSAVFIMREVVKPKWLASDDLIDVNHFLVLTYFDEHTGLLFIHSSIKTNQFYDQLIKVFAAGNYERISKFQINKVLVDISDAEFFNIGMQNRSANSGESYRIIAGPNAEKTIRKSHAKNYANGHVFMKGTSEGERITIGYSTGSKVWSNAYEKIPNYIKWCKKVANKIACDKEVKTNTGFDNLPIGTPVTEFPLPAQSAVWHSDTFSDPPLIHTMSEDEIIATHQLLDFEIVLVKAHCNHKKLFFELICDEIRIPISYDFENHFQLEVSSDVNYVVETSNISVAIEHYLNENPLIVYLDDFATIINHDYFPPPKEGEFQYNVDLIANHDWITTNTDIKREFYETLTIKSSNGNKNSIHETIQQKLITENHDVVIYDHGTGEIADFITIKEFVDRIEIVMHHVKGSSGDEPGDRVGDVYEVCMQAVKSQAWVTNKESFRRKIESRVAGKPNKFLVGNFLVFESIISKAKRIQNHFAIIQPGISKNTFSSKVSYILAAADDSIQNNGYEPLIVIGS